MDETPHFQNAFLDSLASAFRTRRRSLSENACRAELTRSPGVDGQEHEELKIQLGGIVGKGPVLKFHAWADRRVRIDARQPAKLGCAWSWTRDGRLADECGPRTFIEAIEATYALIGDMTPTRTATLDATWKALLAK
jgi:hypothetical protein